MAATGAAGFVLGRRSAAKGLTKAADGGQNGFYAMPHDPNPGSLGEQTGVHAMVQFLSYYLCMCHSTQENLHFIAAPFPAFSSHLHCCVCRSEFGTHLPTHSLGVARSSNYPELTVPGC